MLILFSYHYPSKHYGSAPSLSFVVAGHVYLYSLPLASITQVNLSSNEHFYSFKFPFIFPSFINEDDYVSGLDGEDYASGVDEVDYAS